MASDVGKDGSPTPNSSKAVDEAAALSTLVSALAPLEQVARIRLLRTISTFFELPFGELRGGANTVLTQRIGVGGESEPRGNANPSFSEDRSISPKAFLIEKRPQSDVERIACLAYYLTHYRDQPNFKTLDLSKLNTEAAQIKLSNPTRAVDNASSAHFLIQAGQGKKQLSAIGELYVQALPDRVAAREAIADLKKKRSRVKSRASGDDFGSGDDGVDALGEGGGNGGN